MHTPAPTPNVPSRQPYAAPRLQHLGRWEQVTLIQSVPINPRLPNPWNQKSNDW